MQGVKKMAVASYDEIEKVQDVGNSNRTVGATLMNATSSRAHTIVTISLTQLMKEDGRTKELSSDIVLVDLAGSERAESTGATGARLQEGIEINVSLSALGNVISALAEKANNPTKKVFIPYRSHCLTELLQSALGGNSKTIMVPLALALTLTPTPTPAPALTLALLPPLTLTLILTLTLTPTPTPALTPTLVPNPNPNPNPSPNP